MKATTTATALALLLGLGLALPAAAQQTGTTGEQTGTAGQQTGTAGAGAGAAGADVDQDQFVTGEEAAAYDEQRFDEITGGGEEMTEEQFTGAMTGAQDAAGLFGEADADQSGTLNREEWTQWRGQRFDEATAGTEGRMEAGQHEEFDVGGETM